MLHFIEKYRRIGRGISLLTLLLGVILLTGCMYSGNENAENPAVIDDNIALVQHAIEKYQSKTGVLPIKNSSMETPIYEKYVIDFERLQSQNSIGHIPSSAFAKGGHYYFVLIDPEQHPTVKLMDLKIYQQIGDIQSKVTQYYRDHDHRLPLGDQVAPHFHYIDFKKMNMENVQIQSPYSNMFLSPVISDNGEVGLDYGPEIMKLLQQGEDALNDSIDLRTLLVEKSPFVPVKSFPYYLVNGEPRISVSK